MNEQLYDVAIPWLIQESIKVILPSGIVDESNESLPNSLAVMELIKVEMELKNPLKIPIMLTNYRLEFEFNPEADSDTENIINSQIDQIQFDPREMNRVSHKVILDYSFIKAQK